MADPRREQYHPYFSGSVLDPDDLIPPRNLKRLLELREQVGRTSFDEILTEVHTVLNPRLGILIDEVAKMKGGYLTDEVHDRYMWVCNAVGQLHPDHLDRVAVTV